MSNANKTGVDDTTGATLPKLSFRVELPKRVRWTMKRGSEMKKQGELRSEPTSRATMFLRGKPRNLKFQV